MFDKTPYEQPPTTSGKNLLKSFEEEETPNKPQDENAINTSPPKTPNMSDVQEKGDEDNTPDITKQMQENKILNPEELPGDEKADKDDEEDKNTKEKNVAEEEKRDKKNEQGMFVTLSKEASGNT